MIICLPWWVFLLMWIGMVSSGYLVGAMSVAKWRRRWIELEHEFAKATKRKPRSIIDVFRE